MKQEFKLAGEGTGRRAFVGLCFLVGFAILLFRFFDLQVLQAETMMQKARRQHEKTITLDSNRGAIFDRQGKPLALNLDVPSVYATPSSLDNPTRVARQLAQVLGVPREPLEKRLRTERDFVWIQRKIDDSQVERLNDLALPGVGVMVEARRFYPKGTLLAHVLGFAGIDSQGLEGLENGYDEHLRGQVRRVVLQRDALGRVIIPESQRKSQPLSGHAISLTIDEVIQYIAEQALEQTVRNTKARGGTVLVMAPKTGQMLAWALRPTFDPNHIHQASPERWRNRGVTDPYEPGSTLKVVLAAAALELNRVTPDTLLYAGDGEIPISGTVIHDHEKAGWVTFREAIQRSSNVAFVKMSWELGREQVYQFLRTFGFGEKTGIDLPGESIGILRRPDQWSQRTLPSLAIGQEIAVTPLQLLTAVSAVANEGWLMRPFLVREISDHQGRSVWEHVPHIRRRPISAETAKTVTDLLVNVVDRGTGKRAAIPGYRVAGKTGTAQKVDPATGTYSSTKFVGSFVGFVPAEDPQLAILVMIDEPQGPAWGGVVAAPVFRKVAEQALRYLSVAPGEEARMVASRSSS
jgi:cell division protein FtsI (penicillin-binding protein 3)